MVSGCRAPERNFSRILNHSIEPYWNDRVVGSQIGIGHMQLFFFFFNPTEDKKFSILNYSTKMQGVVTECMDEDLSPAKNENNLLDNWYMIFFSFR